MPDNLINKLEEYNLFNKKQNRFIAITEAVCAVVAGAFIANLFIKYTTGNLVLALVFLAIFLYLFFRRSLREDKFSLTALGELKSTIELKDKTKEVERKNILENYISDAIKALNADAFSYDNNDFKNAFCDERIENGLKLVYQPHFNDPQNLLDTRKAKFTVGAYLKELYKLPHEYEETIKEPGKYFNIFVPRDDLDLKMYFSRVILTDPDLKETYFIIQTQFLDTIKHSRFLNSVLTYNSNEYTFITAPIPAAANEKANGIFFVLCEKLDGIPADFENVTMIFSRLFSNWLSKYNASILHNFENLKTKPLTVTTAPQIIPGNIVVKIPEVITQAVASEKEPATTNAEPVAPATEPAKIITENTEIIKQIAEAETLTLEEAITFQKEKHPQATLFSLMEDNN